MQAAASRNDFPSENQRRQNNELRYKSEGCKTPAPRVRFRSFGDSSLDHEVLCWVERPVLRGRVSHALNCEVYKRFLKDGIEIPFPQRDVHIRPAPVPPGAPE
jgi:MscS family membrane protein